MTGGTHRGPAGLRRQARAVRLTQILLVVVAAGLLLFAGYGWGRDTAAGPGHPADPESRPSLARTVVLAVLAAGALGTAFALQGPGGVRIPTPARLEELAGRAEAEAVQRASAAAGRDPGS